MCAIVNDICAELAILRDTLRTDRFRRIAFGPVSCLLWVSQQLTWICVGYRTDLSFSFPHPFIPDRMGLLLPKIVNEETYANDAQQQYNENFSPRF
jgi:hypothetical protein